jgi:transcriptional regulator with PAS, ATPase and Fis domain
MPKKKVVDGKPAKSEEKKVVAATKTTEKRKASASDRSSAESFPIVGVETSAGGLEAFTEFLKSAHKFAENVLATMREPLVVLDADMKVVMANKSFNQMFQAKPSEVLNKVIYELGDRQWDNEDFKQAIKKVLSTGVATDGLIIDSVFPDSERQIFLLNMRPLPS